MHRGRQRHVNIRPCLHLAGDIYQKLGNQRKQGSPMRDRASRPVRGATTQRADGRGLTAVERAGGQRVWKEGWDQWGEQWGDCISKGKGLRRRAPSLPGPPRARVSSLFHQPEGTASFPCSPRLGTASFGFLLSNLHLRANRTFPS